MSNVYIGSCDLIAEALGVKVYCCSSCHEDEDKGYFDLGESYESLTDPDSVYVTRCCGGLEAIKDHADPWPLLKSEAARRTTLDAGGGGE